MGDRALVIFTDGEEISPVAYLHWSGSHVPTLLAELKTIMRGREGDVSYAAARFIGLCHTKIDGNLSLGTLNLPEEMKLAVILRDKASPWATEALTEYSHGDAGVVIVNASTFEFQAYGGYLADYKESIAA